MEKKINFTVEEVLNTIDFCCDSNMSDYDKDKLKCAFEKEITNAIPEIKWDVYFEENLAEYVEIDAASEHYEVVIRFFVEWGDDDYDVTCTYLVNDQTYNGYSDINKMLVDLKKDIAIKIIKKQEIIDYAMKYNKYINDCDDDEHYYTLGIGFDRDNMGKILYSMYGGDIEKEFSKFVEDFDSENFWVVFNAYDHYYDKQEVLDGVLGSFIVEKEF